MTSALLTLGDLAMDALGIVNEPAPAFKFYVEILGVIVGEFTECSGLGAEREVFKYREGGTNDFEWILPGQVTYSNITLKRGITYSRELWRWFNHGTIAATVYPTTRIRGKNISASSVAGALGGKIGGKIGGMLKSLKLPAGVPLSIMLGNAQGLLAKQWDITGAVPVRWTGPEFNTASEQIAIESLEFAHHGIDLSIEMMTPMAGIISAGIEAATGGSSFPTPFNR